MGCNAIRDIFYTFTLSKSIKLKNAQQKQKLFKIFNFQKEEKVSVHTLFSLENQNFFTPGYSKKGIYFNAVPQR